MVFNESGSGLGVGTSNNGCYDYSASQLKRQDTTGRLPRQKPNKAPPLGSKPHTEPRGGRERGVIPILLLEDVRDTLRSGEECISDMQRTNI